ncbi:MAG: hypothetical protein WA061_02545 [Microgenomates group bacterium]
MRNPKRIKSILSKMEKLWNMYPDMRLGQLLYNYAGFSDKDYNREDFETEIALDQSVYEHTPAGVEEEYDSTTYTKSVSHKF